ncbi:MAG: hypothetical protein QOF48_3118 [Verrucomicrobiota bacterium]
MQRLAISPRHDWQRKLEEIGLTYHTHADGPYWDESAYYQLTAREVDDLEVAGNTLHQLCIDAAEAVIRNEWWNRLSIPAAAIPAIKASWERDDFSLYGRFDFAYDGSGPPKLFEYNADTPTALLEASVAQWHWLKDGFAAADQFNSIHERLIESWKKLAPQRIHFAAVKDHPEDEQTVLYLQDTCLQAGFDTRRMAMEDIGWDARRSCFTDLDEEKIETLFKLYPWEWLWHEEFAVHLPSEPARFIEPAWKMLLSNKGLLPVLWELNPGHPNLLPCFDTPEPLAGNFAQKPRLSREGSNITLVENGVVVEKNEGEYGEEGCVYQALAKLPDFDGRHPVMGVWMIDQEAAGLGIREDTCRITGNLSRFVPHLF